jgi:hypothetical protein
MAHTVIDGKVVVDWKAGDPEGDRITLLAAYKELIEEIQAAALNDEPGHVTKVLEKWNVSTDNQIDEVPRIWIKRPL